MADNETPYGPRAVLRRLLQLAAALYSLVFIVPMLVLMIIYMALSPDGLRLNDYGTTHVRFDMHINHERPAPIHPTRRHQRGPTNPRPPTPHSASATRIWRYRDDTSQTMPPFMQARPRSPPPPPPHEPAPQTYGSWYTMRPQTFSYSSNDPFQQFDRDPLPPARPGAMSNPPYFTRSRSPLPPARPGQDSHYMVVSETPSPVLPPSLPSLIFESGEEPLPRYEHPPPEYSDDGYESSMG